MRGPPTKAAAAHTRTFCTPSCVRQAPPPSRRMRQGSRASKSSTQPAPSQREKEPAPTPTTSWNNPLYRAASRVPRQLLPYIRLGTDAPLADLKVAPLTQKELHRANTLFFGPHAGCELGGTKGPRKTYAPPIAVPAGAQVGEGPGRKAVIRSLLDSQVRAGDYTPYLPKQTLHDPSLRKPDAARKPEKRALIDADQAMSANASLHPMARRFVIERIAAQLRTTS